MYNHYKPGSVCKRFLTERQKTYIAIQIYKRLDKQTDRETGKKTESQTYTHIVIQTHICKQF